MLKKTFTIADPSLVSDISLSVASDNGFIVWINGDEVYRGNGNWFTSYWEYDNLTVSSSLLATGTNKMYVLALDDDPLHVNDATFFDMQMTANMVPVPTTIILFVTGLAALVGIKRRAT